jgi:thiol-disulfide isomerase/thioredoxin
MLNRANMAARRVLLASFAVLIGGAMIVAIDRYGAAFLQSSKATHRPAFAATDPSTGAPQSSDLDFFILDMPRTLPDLHFIDGDGREMTLADFRGKVVLLNIWATWCVPCRKEMPALDRLQSELGGSDFQVLALSIDRQGKAVVEPFYRELGLKTLAIYIDQTGKATQALHTVGVPTTLLIDRDGREVGRKMGAAEWDSSEIVEIIRRHVGPPSNTGRTNLPTNPVEREG